MASAGLLAGCGSGTSAQAGAGVSSKASAVAVPALSSTQWTFCANENSTCLFTGEQTVRYGAGDTFISKKLSWNAACNNATFGDPAPGQAKHCEVTSQWEFCANENQQCGFGDTQTVRYGSGNAFFSKTVSNGLACDNNTFGDPAVGAAKHCDRTPTTWTLCADENGVCGFGGAQVVLYGANGSFTTRNMTDGASCNNAVFGDPIAGVAKHCYIPGAPVADVSNPVPGTCSAVTWTAGVNYSLNTVVKYPPDGNYYKVVNVGANGSDATIPTISTYYWAVTTCGNTPAVGVNMVGGYYPNWKEGKDSPLRIKDVNPRYNMIYLFAAEPVGGAPGTTGAVTWKFLGDERGAASHLVEDIKYARTVQGRKIMLSVGGAGKGMSFPNRGKSQNFVNSIVSIYNQLGGFDGMDWNTFEGSQSPDTNEMIWISLELKRLYPGFIISAPPAPWNPVDKAFCQAMVNAGAMDYAAPQYYDGPGLNEPEYVVKNVAEWVALLGAKHVAVGFGINTEKNYMTRDQAISIWRQVKLNHPGIRGGFDWEINTDEQQGWPFANGVAPLMNP